MSASPSRSDRSAVVTRLRAAGCVFAEDEAALLISAARTATDLDAMVDRRADGLPLEQVLGWAEFCGQRVLVDPGVFVPRRRTEFLVEQAAEAARHVASEQPLARAPVVLDLCCGSGAIGVALRVALPRIELYAVDIDPAAVRCARRNVSGAGGHVLHGDLFEPLPPRLRGQVDVVVANAPYVPTESIPMMPAEARLHEPRVALDGGSDGLEVLRRIAAGSPHWLAAGGRLLVETSTRQAPYVVEAIARSGLIPTVATSEERNASVVVATRPARKGAKHG